MDKITAVRADDPKDVIWENASYSNCWRFGRRILTFIIALTFIMVTVFSLVYINAVKNNAQSDIYVLKEAGKLVKPQRFYKIQAWSVLVAAIIILTNETGRVALQYFVNEQNFPT